MSREDGRRYRDMVLRVGRRQAEMKTLTDYLGHAPSIRPYLSHGSEALMLRFQPSPERETRGEVVRGENLLC